MNIFKKSKKKDSCCAIQFEEVKEDNKTESACCGDTNAVDEKKKTVKTKK